MTDEQIEELTTKYGFDKIGIIEGEMFLPMKEVFEKLVQRWIPCSERLPEEGTEVIVTDKNGSVWSDIYFDYKDKEDASPCFHRWDDEMWQCFTPDVLAWMPLPESYKEEGEVNAM